MNKFKSFLTRFKWHLQRWKYIKMARTNFNTPSDFALLQNALTECIEDFENNCLPLPHLGICFNAGFLYYLGSVSKTKNRKLGRLFLGMCAEFNRHRGVAKQPFQWPFGGPGDRDVWSGDKGKVRVDAMRWIIGQIQHYRLYD